MQMFGRGPGAWLKGVKQHLEGLVIEGTLLPGDKESAIEATRVYLQKSEGQS